MLKFVSWKICIYLIFFCFIITFSETLIYLFICHGIFLEGNEILKPASITDESSFTLTAKQLNGTALELTSVLDTTKRSVHGKYIHIADITYTALTFLLIVVNTF
jgi:hypothetical protein